MLLSLELAVFVSVLIDLIVAVASVVAAAVLAAAAAAAAVVVVVVVVVAAAVFVVVVAAAVVLNLNVSVVASLDLVDQCADQRPKAFDFEVLGLD